MKKKLVVLMMASTMALAACGSKETAETTAAVVTEASTETEAETTVDETTEESTEEAEESETDAEAAESEEAEESEVDAAAIGAMDMKAALELTGITIEEKDDNYVMTYPAEMFADMDKEAIEAAVTADAEGVVTVNEDGSVTLELTKEQYDAMEDAFNQTLDAATAIQ